MQKRSSSPTLFIDKTSWVHQLHPFTKLSYILLACVVTYAGIFDWKQLLCLLGCNMVLVTSSRLLVETMQAVWRIMLPLSLFMIPIHSFLNPENETALLIVSGFTVYQEGFCFALITLLKLLVVLFTSLLFVFSTHPADLISSISQSGRSSSLAYLLGSPLLLLAGMRERIEVIKAAQQARGLDTGGNFFKRIFSLAPLVMPLVTGAIVEVEQRSIALEVRGFKSTSVKTSYRRIPDSTLQRYGRWLFLFTALGIVTFQLIRLL